MTFVIRKIRPDDAEQNLELERRLLEDGRGMVLGIEQLADLNQERKRLEVQENSQDVSCQWVAGLSDGSIVGNAQLQVFKPRLCRHVACLSLGVHPDYQSQGIGRALMQTLMRHAEAASLRRLELYVRADNPRAINLYASLGFVKEACRRNFVRLPDGRFVDDVIMVKFLNELNDQVSEGVGSG